jgi:uncharacterized protein YbjT (DUF2867 family)
MKNALVAGATGLVGSELVARLVKTEYYNSVHVITRRPYTLEHLKITPHTLDFDQISSFEPKARIQDLYICLGTTMKKAGSKEKFRVVDYQYVVSLTEWALKNGIEKVSVISSIGANPLSSNFYLHTKGEMEQALIKMNLPCLSILRPSLLLGKRNELRFAEKMSEIVMKPLTWLMIGKLKKFRPVKAETVARAMLHTTIHNVSSLQVIENEAIFSIDFRE